MIHAMFSIKQSKKEAEAERQRRYARNGGPPRRTSQDMPTTRDDLYAKEMERDQEENVEREMRQVEQEAKKS